MTLEGCSQFRFFHSTHEFTSDLLSFPCAIMLFYLHPPRRQGYQIPAIKPATSQLASYFQTRNHIGLLIYLNSSVVFIHCSVAPFLLQSSATWLQGNKMCIHSYIAIVIQVGAAGPSGNNPWISAPAGTTGGSEKLLTELMRQQLPWQRYHLRFAFMIN